MGLNLCLYAVHVMYDVLQSSLIGFICLEGLFFNCLNTDFNANSKKSTDTTNIHTCIDILYAYLSLLLNRAMRSIYASRLFQVYREKNRPRMFSRSLRGKEFVFIRSVTFFHFKMCALFVNELLFVRCP